MKSVPEFIAYAKANRGKLSIGFDNTAGAAAFAAKLVNRRADLGLVEVPYRASAQASQDRRRRHHAGDGQFDRVRRAPCVEAGKVRRIAVTSAKRFPGLPDLPSISETVPGVVMNGWFAVVAPAGAPPDVIRGSTATIGALSQGSGHPEAAVRLWAARPRGPERPRAPRSSSGGSRTNGARSARNCAIEPQ